MELVCCSWVSRTWRRASKWNWAQPSNSVLSWLTELTIAVTKIITRQIILLPVRHAAPATTATMLIITTMEILFVKSYLIPSQWGPICHHRDSLLWAPSTRPSLWVLLTTPTAGLQLAPRTGRRLHPSDIYNLGGITCYSKGDWTTKASKHWVWHYLYMNTYLFLVWIRTSVSDSSMHNWEEKILWRTI